MQINFCFIEANLLMPEIRTFIYEADFELVMQQFCV